MFVACTVLFVVVLCCLLVVCCVCYVLIRYCTACSNCWQWAACAVCWLRAVCLILCCSLFIMRFSVLFIKCCSGTVAPACPAHCSIMGTPPVTACLRCRHKVTAAVRCQLLCCGVGCSGTVSVAAVWFWLQRCSVGCRAAAVRCQSPWLWSVAVPDCSASCDASRPADRCARYCASCDKC